VEIGEKVHPGICPVISVCVYSRLWAVLSQLTTRARSAIPHGKEPAPGGCPPCGSFLLSVGAPQGAMGWWTHWQEVAGHPFSRLSPLPQMISRVLAVPTRNRKHCSFILRESAGKKRQHRHLREGPRGRRPGGGPHMGNLHQPSLGRPGGLPTPGSVLRNERERLLLGLDQ
jgi:hypothetical protein